MDDRPEEDQAADRDDAYSRIRERVQALADDLNEMVLADRQAAATDAKKLRIGVVARGMVRNWLPDVPAAPDNPPTYTWDEEPVKAVFGAEAGAKASRRRGREPDRIRNGKIVAVLETIKNWDKMKGSDLRSKVAEPLEAEAPGTAPEGRGSWPDYYDAVADRYFRQTLREIVVRHRAG